MIDTVLPFLFSKAIACFTLAYTGPRSPIRVFAIVVIAACSWVAAQSTVAEKFPGAIGPEYILGWTIQANNWLNLSRLAYQPPSKSFEKPYARLRWAFYQIFDTRYGVDPSLIPHFDKHRPRWVPSRSLFLLWKVWNMIWTGALMYASSLYEPLDITDLLDVPSGFLLRLPQLTTREALLRIYVTLHAIGMAYMSLVFMHSIAGFVAVSAGDDPVHWPPLHGSPRSITSMREFYKTFWHHCMRKGLTKHAILVVNDVMHFPRKSLITRYMIVLFTFIISGLYHAALTPQIPWQCSMLQLPYQLRLVGAIFLEDVVIMIYDYLRPSTKSRVSKKLKVDDSTTATIDNETARTGDLAIPQQDGLKLRRNVDPKEQKDYPKSPMPQNQTLLEEQQVENHSWKAVVAVLAGYLWAGCFLVWALSKMVYGTQQCLLLHTLKEYDLFDNDIFRL